MPQGDPLTLRMAIQQVGIEKPTYRVVVYGDSTKPMHADFSDAKALLISLQGAIPDLDPSSLTPNSKTARAIAAAGCLLILSVRSNPKSLTAG